MSDEELRAIVQAVKAVLAERETAARTEVESLRQDLNALQVKVLAHREADAERTQRLMKMIADAVGDAFAPRLLELQRRTAALEQRAISTEAAQ